jgi:hypothetical protein
MKRRWQKWQQSGSSSEGSGSGSNSSGERTVKELQMMVEWLKW